MLSLMPLIFRIAMVAHSSWRHVRHVSVPEDTLRRGYQGSLFRGAVANIPAAECGDRRAFQSRKWTCRPPGRRFAWLGLYRRLPKDWQNLNRTALAFLRFAWQLLRFRRGSSGLDCGNGRLW